jgi:hypothetical protein
MKFSHFKPVPYTGSLNREDMLPRLKGQEGGLQDRQKRGKS